MEFLFFALSCCWLSTLVAANGNASDTFGTWYLDGNDKGTKAVSRYAGAAYQPSSPFTEALYLDDNSYATIKRAEIWNTDFTLHTYIKSTGGGGQRRTILASWETAKWLFMFRITLANQLKAVIRRNKYNTGSDRRQDMVSVTGGNIELNQWYSVAFSWERQTGEMKVYINGVEVASKRTTYPDRDLMRTSASTFQIGYKADGRHDFFKGYIAELTITNDVTKTCILSEWAKRIAPKPASNTFGKWRLDGSDGGNKNVSRYVTAAYQPSAPFAATLYLDGNSYATIKRAAISNVDFTMHTYIKSTEGDGEYRTILASWEAAKWLFIFRITPGNQLQVALRRNKYNTGNDRRQDMVSVTGGNIELNQWYSVAFSWERQTGEAKVYINGVEVASKRTTYPDRDLMRSSASTFQIGYKADGRHHFFKGYIAELTIDNDVLKTCILSEWAKRIAPTTTTTNPTPQPEPAPTTTTTRPSSPTEPAPTTTTTNPSPPPVPVTPGTTDREVPEALRLCTMSRVNNARMLSTDIESLPEIQTEGACAAKCLEVPLCDSATFRNESKECIIHPRRDFMMGQMAREGCCVLFRKECPLLRNLGVPPPEQILCPVDAGLPQPSQKYAYRQLRFVKNYDVGAYSCRIDTLCAGFSSEKSAVSTDLHFTYYYNSTPEEGAQTSNQVSSANAVKNCKPNGQVCRLVTALFNKRPSNADPYSTVPGVATQADCLARCEKASVCTVATFIDSSEKECMLYTDFYIEGGLGTMEFEVYRGIGKAMTWFKDMQCNVVYT
ncbi:uncharacterized protein LOC135491645 [Lineus longissimus]|uniref:uncharacterized protein LOC135491645 n=1 Tax=Lineus longissimus TaxID=88925 RepID=UPI002B4CEA8C